MKCAGLFVTTHNVEKAYFPSLGELSHCFLSLHLLPTFCPLYFQCLTIFPRVPLVSPPLRHCYPFLRTTFLIYVDTFASLHSVLLTTCLTEGSNVNNPTTSCFFSTCLMFSSNLTSSTITCLFAL